MCSSKPYSLRSSVGLVRVASDYGYAIQICTGANETHRLDQLKQMIYGKQVDGLPSSLFKLNDPLVTTSVFKINFLSWFRKNNFSFVSLVGNFDNVKAALMRPDISSRKDT